jgi:hypothetical protein
MEHPERIHIALGGGGMVQNSVLDILGIPLGHEVY